MGAVETRQHEEPIATHEPARTRGRLAVVAMPPSVLKLLRPDLEFTGIGIGKGGGGAELQATRIGQALAERGWDVTFVIKNWGQTEQQVAERLRIINAHDGLGRSSGLRGFVSHVLPKYWSALRRADADLYFHRGLSGFAGWSGMFCRLHRRKLVLSLASNMDVNLKGQGPVHDAKGPDRWLGEYAKRHATLTVAQTRHQQRLYEAQYRPRCLQIPNMVEIGPEPGVFAPEPLILWAGSMRAGKRPEMVLEVARRMPEVRFALAGGPVRDGEAYFEQVRQQADKLPNVELLGWVPQEQMREQYERAWGLLMTAPPDREGFPNVLLQAWERARPTVSSFEPDQIMEEHGIGFTAPTVDDMVKGLGVVCHDTATAQRMGQAARDYVIAHHAPQIIGDAYDQALTALL
jgi:glycosyltransferase involved in cell wall biosynthesis